jgi:uncharacterized protein (DUF1810 family)
MSSDDTFGHFVKAQDGGTYEQALEEIAEGEKKGHWMWFIFPQIDGLGTSAKAKNTRSRISMRPAPIASTKS